MVHSNYIDMNTAWILKPTVTKTTNNDWFETDLRSWNTNLSVRFTPHDWKRKQTQWEMTDGEGKDQRVIVRKEK